MLGAALLALDGGGVAVSGRLVVCPTPIGNLEDITLRVLAALREADVIAAEDTRHTRALLDRYGVSAPLVSYHEHNEERRAAELVDAHAGGRGRRAGVGRRDAARLGPGLRARARVRGGGAGGGGAARAVGRADRAGGLGAAVGLLAVRRVPAAQARRAAAGVRAAGRRDARGVRVAAAGARDAGGAGGGRSAIGRSRSCAS